MFSPADLALAAKVVEALAPESNILHALRAEPKVELPCLSPELWRMIWGFVGASVVETFRVKLTTPTSSVKRRTETFFAGWVSRSVGGSCFVFTV